VYTHLQCVRSPARVANCRNITLACLGEDWDWLPVRLLALRRCWPCQGLCHWDVEGCCQGNWDCGSWEREGDCVWIVGWVFRCWIILRSWECNCYCCQGADDESNAHRDNDSRFRCYSEGLTEAYASDVVPSRYFCSSCVSHLPKCRPAPAR
jgi:hypothetical protein